MTLELCPITFPEACEFIAKYHRHHQPPQGWKFGIGCSNGERIVGVVTIGRPVARNLQDGWTLEVTRLCTDGTPHVASKLYSAAARAVKAMGYKRLITYILLSETGTSLTAAGWRYVWTTQGGSWSRASRPRVDKAPLGQKQLWEAG